MPKMPKMPPGSAARRVCCLRAAHAKDHAGVDVERQFAAAACPIELPRNSPYFGSQRPVILGTLVYKRCDAVAILKKGGSCDATTTNLQCAGYHASSNHSGLTPCPAAASTVGI
jgi:hypothetical protein